MRTQSRCSMRDDRSGQTNARHERERNDEEKKMQTFPKTQEQKRRVAEERGRITDLDGRIAAAKERLADEMAKEEPNEKLAEQQQCNVEALIRERERAVLKIETLEQRIERAEG